MKQTKYLDLCQPVIAAKYLLKTRNENKLIMEFIINAWQQLPAQINPTLFSFGSFQVRYYSLMYLVAFAVVYFLTLYRIKNEGYKYTAETIQDYLVWAMLGVIIGGRFGYALFYNFGYYVQHPLEIILPFDFSHGFKFVGISGMSYHGGLIGVVIAFILFCRKRRLTSGILEICSVRRYHWATPLAGSAILSTENFLAV